MKSPAGFFMAENPYSPSKPSKSLAERLGATGNKIAELSKQAATATKDAVSKVADAGKEAAAKTSQAVADAKESRKEKKEEKLTKKIEETRAELKQDGHIELAPAMITLPEFEEERMALMAEEHDILVDLVDHMHALSERVDQLEQTYRALAIEEKAKLQLTAEKDDEKPAAPTSQGMTSALSLLGASLVWVVLLTGLDRYLASNEVMVFGSYPAEIPVWGVGAGSWVMFVVYQIGKGCTVLASFHTHARPDWIGGGHHHRDGLVALGQHHLNHVKCLDVGNSHRRGGVGFLKFGGQRLAKHTQCAHADRRD